MGKIMAKTVTRLQRLLAAIAGDAVAPTPITNQEKLLYNIAEEMKDMSARAEPFIITLTPTSLDYSGVMDRTVAEIDEAYRAGKKLVFRVMNSETQYMDVDCTARYNDGSTYPSFNGFILSTDNGGELIFAWTGATNDGTVATYGTTIYPLSYPSANGVSF